MFSNQRIRDPLHGLISFQANEFEDVLWQVIQSIPFQRLRRVRQLGFSELIYPGAVHSRFAHSLGVFNVARDLMKIVHTHEGAEFRQSRSERALAAALVHDVGHGAFSHAFESVGKRLNLRMAADHELVSDHLIRHSELADCLNKLGSGFANDVANVIKGGPTDIYSAVVSSQFDADRLDYMQRDRLMTGTESSKIDYTWLTANLEIGSIKRGVDEEPLDEVKTFVIGPKAIQAAEAYVLGLFQLYPTVYFHKATRGAEKLFVELFCRVIELVVDGSHRRTGLPAAHPIVKFAKEPEAISNILNLDDLTIWGALSMLSDSKDKIVSEISTRLNTRCLYKSINVRNYVLNAIADNKSHTDSEVGKKVNMVCARAGERIVKHLEASRKQAPDKIPLVLWDEAERVPYKNLDESKGLLNQITIRDSSDSLVDLRNRSAVIRAIEHFRLNRLYVPERNAGFETKILKIIDEEVSNVKAN